MKAVFQKAYLHESPLWSSGTKHGPDIALKGAHIKELKRPEALDLGSSSKSLKSYGIFSYLLFSQTLGNMFMYVFVALALLVYCSSAEAHNPELPSGFAIEEDYIVGLEKPTDLAIAPDGRIFITEKGGTVRIVENGVLLPQPFYTVQTQVPNERGLDGIILDPDFDSNGYVYLYYTLPFENKNNLARVTAAGNTALPNSEVELFRFDDMWASWHNGGGMAFDNTGKLLIGTGDGTAYTAGQGLYTTLGKILRINRDGTIPTDNPFYTQLTGDLRAIAAYGVRNPYTMAKSKLTGRIFFNDVGSDYFEEVNEYSIGKNYGFHLVEGMLGNASPPDNNYQDPLYAYDHSYGCAIVGAGFYEPDILLFPSDYFGKYFFMEYCEGIIMCMDPADNSVTEFATELKGGYNNLEISSDGYLYILNVTDGEMARISYQGVAAPPLISIQPRPQTVPVGESVDFEVAATGDTLSYEWFVNGISSQNGITPFFALNNVQLSDDQSVITVQVTNPHGSTMSNPAVLSVVNGSRPAIQFSNIPLTYAAGDTIHFAAQVSDPDQAAFPLSDFSWRIDFHHDDHFHPALSNFSGISAGTYVVETFGEVDTNVYYRIHVTALDSSGLTANEWVDVNPEKVNIQIQSEPVGVEVNVDGARNATNFTMRSVKNLNRTIEASPYAVVGDSLYQFFQWFDGQDTLVRVFPAKEDTLTLQYTALQEYFAGSPTTGTLTIFKDTAASQQFYGQWQVESINENWDILSPYPWDNPPFPEDYFSATWEGSIVAPVSDMYHFFLFHDSKASLEVGGNLLIDGSVANSPLQEDTVQVWLNGGDSLHLKVSYDHYTYISRVELDWQYSIVDRQKVKFSAFNPPVSAPNPFISDDEDGVILFPNPTDRETVNLLIDLVRYPNKEYRISVYDNLGRLMLVQNGKVNQAQIPMDVSNFPAGIYSFQVQIGTNASFIKFLKE